MGAGTGAGGAGIRKGGGLGATMGGRRLRPSARAGLTALRAISPAARQLSSFIAEFQTSVGPGDAAAMPRQS